jgi:hypothetical protein
MSTFFNFNLINRDMRQSLDRVANQPLVVRGADYYRENIGKVQTVEAFLDDYRLYSYAMEAHGLEDMIYARAFMQRVLESDLTDRDSFANKLTDERYREFAAAFQFGPNGTPAVRFDVQTDYQEDLIIGLYSEQIVTKNDAVRADTTYFLDTIDSIRDVDQFLRNGRLVDYALKAAGIDTQYYSAATIRQVLTSDLSDPQSFANASGSSAYVTLASRFSFQPDGTVAPDMMAQSAEQKTALTESYVFFAAGRSTPLAAEWNTQNFVQKAQEITSVSELLGDTRLYQYLTTTFQLPPSLSLRSELTSALRSDLSDPESFANQPGNEVYRRIAGFFNFDTDGNAVAGTMIDEPRLSELTAIYNAVHDLADRNRDASRTATFQAAIDLVVNVDGLMRNSLVYNFVLTAVGLDPAQESKTRIKQMLISDLNDPNSAANRSGDARYKLLAAAFNFDSAGNVTYARVAQSDAEITTMATAYLSTFEARGQTSEEAQARSQYYKEAIGRVTQGAQLLADPMLIGYALDSFGLSVPAEPRNFLQQLFSSDLSDPDSFANTLVDKRFAQLVASYNFAPDGSILLQPDNAIQSKRSIMNTTELYLRQTLEKQAGEENAGVRLALYFQRKAPEMMSYFDILADPALQEVVFTALGIPKEMAQSDIDRQVAFLRTRFELDEFKDPEQLNRFLVRFAGLYDLDNDTTPSLVTALFSNSGQAGISVDTLATLAQLRFRP